MTAWPQGDAPCAEPKLVRVKDSVDGDTSWVAPEDGSRDLDVRFIGVDTPEIDHGDGADCYGNEAWAFTSRALDGKLAWLTFDAECLDVYDRTLAYVITGEGDEGFFNRRLAREGYAEALSIEPNTTFAEDIERDVRDARQAGLGLWGACR
jgi:micrococcal nuclease